jgi:GNAT superfamily N-acetyltransferase
MTITESLQFQKLDYEGLKTLVQWAEQEGWNPGPYDAETYWATDPDGYYGYFDKGELIAGGSIVSYNQEFGFMGFFIVKPEYRAAGIGRKLWYQRRDALLSRLNDGAAIGMDGVVDMQDFYQRGGFEIAYKDERYERIGEQFPIDNNITEITDEDLPAIMEYDRQCFGYSRPQFLLPWLKMPESKTFKYNSNGKLLGFAIVRKANVGYKVCPLFADTPQIAEELYKACLNSVVGEPLYLDIPMVNKSAISLVEKYGAKYVFECARMYLGTPPAVDTNKIYGITTFELG